MIIEEFTLLKISHNDNNNHKKLFSSEVITNKNISNCFSRKHHLRVRH